jgi:hypothetical protein
MARGRTGCSPGVRASALCRTRVCRRRLTASARPSLPLPGAADARAFRIAVQLVPSTQIAGVWRARHKRPFQPPPACRRSEADRPLYRPDHHSTHHQTADTAHAARLSGASAHVHQWPFERRPWHVDRIARASVSAPWLAEAGTSATDQTTGWPSLAQATPGLRSLMAQNSPRWLSYGRRSHDSAAPGA